jgi:Fic family protein
MLDCFAIAIADNFYERIIIFKRTPRRNLDEGNGEMIMANRLAELLKNERKTKYNGGLYHESQVLFAYNSNHMEGSKLTEDQTRWIFDTKTVTLPNNEVISTDDIFVTSNHFRLFDFMLDTMQEPLNEALIKEYHYTLKIGTSDVDKGFMIGEYKKLENRVGNIIPSDPKNVSEDMQTLLGRYCQNENIGIEHIIDFHVQFERIHPFQDGNGRVGRMIMFKECLAHNITPFIIEDKNKVYYYNGLQRYEQERGFLVETCKAAQDTYMELITKYTNESR